MSTRRGRPLLLSVLLSVFLVRCGNTEIDTSAELDEEGDSAPYAVAVEMAGGGLCAGSLVAARTVLTSASCARGRPARVLTAGGTRRVRRAVTARGADDTVSDELAGGWGGALLDLAVLVLDKSPGPPARPILMAVDAAQCEAPLTACIVAGSLAAPGERRMSLRVAEATVAEGGTCSSRARFWASVRDRALCLTGPKLCANDRGVGVVCSGRLCGVVSKSLGDAGGAEGCGYTHAVQSLPRWRRFLHCAHSQYGCRSEQCSELCTETELLQGSRVEEQERPSPNPSSTPLPDYLPPDDYDTGVSLAMAVPKSPHLTSGPTELRKKAEDKIDIVTPPTVTAKAPTRLRPLRLRNGTSPPIARRRPPPTRSLPAGRRQRPRSEYEPNRPDFRPGEYGDNVVDYGDSEDPLAPAVIQPAQPVIHLAPPVIHPSSVYQPDADASPTDISPPPHYTSYIPPHAPPERLLPVLPPALAPLTSGAGAPIHSLPARLAVSASGLFATVIYYLFSV